MNSGIDHTASISNSFLFSPILHGEDATRLPEFAAIVPSASAGKYWRTLRHLHASQLFYLVSHRILRSNKLSRWPEAPVRLKDLQSQPQMAEWDPMVARQIIENADVR